MLAISHSSVLPSACWNSVGALISDHFHGSIPCLHVPLSTLHVQPCDYPRMTRGQVGSLCLTCTTLAFATSRRFIPAHSNLGPNADKLGPKLGTMTQNKARRTNKIAFLSLPWAQEDPGSNPGAPTKIIFRIFFRL